MGTTTFAKTVLVVIKNTKRTFYFILLIRLHAFTAISHIIYLNINRTRDNIHYLIQILKEILSYI